MLDVLGIKNAAKILPMPEDMKPRDPVTENMAIMQGKPVKVYVAFFDANETLIGTPAEEWAGLIDTMTTDDAPGGESSIVVTAESRYAQFARPRLRRHSDEDQQAAYAGDLFYQYAADMVEKSIVFPNREWFKANT
jgi:hypothetical protein